MTTIPSERVVVLGASPKPERYSNQAVRLLLKHGHQVIPVHPAVERIEGLKVAASLAEAVGPIDTVTMYVGPGRSDAMADELIASAPRRVIFNPGSENPGLANRLTDAGIGVEEACTLVLLNTGQF